MAHPKVNIRALQAFVAVFEEQSFSRAAIRENATQSGMSTQVKNLETTLDAVLLERGKGHFALTRAGQIVYDEGQGILHGLYGLEKRIAELKCAVTGLVKFGMIPALTRAVLPPAMLDFQAIYPNVEVSMLEEYSYSLMRRVLEGELDFAVVPAGDVLNGLSSSFIGKDREVLVGRPGQFPERAQLSPVRPQVLNGLNLILPSSRNVRRNRLETYFDANGVRLGRRLEMDGMLATLEFVAATDWCAVLPFALCYPDQDGSRRKLHPLGGPGMNTDYILVQKSERVLTQAAERLVARIRQETETILNG